VKDSKAGDVGRIDSVLIHPAGAHDCALLRFRQSIFWRFHEQEFKMLRRSGKDLAFPEANRHLISEAVAETSYASAAN